MATLSRCLYPHYWKVNSSPTGRQSLGLAWFKSRRELSWVRLLLAYVKRGKLEERVVLTAIGEETLDGAFRLLKDRLNPMVDVSKQQADFDKSRDP